MSKEKMKSLRIELSLEDDALLEKQVKESGLDKTNYIRKLIRGGGSKGFYSPMVKRALESISEGYCGLREEKVSEEGVKYLEMINGGVKHLWRFSR